MRNLVLDKQASPDTLTTKAADLQPGAYKIAWQVLAPDGHITRGLIPFTVTRTRRHHARSLALRLQGMTFAKVLTSPLQRAARTCELAGFGSVAEIDPDLLEWDQGEYEGRCGADICKERPDLNLFRDGCPGGESPHQVGARANRLAGRVRRYRATCCFF